MVKAIQPNFVDDIQRKIAWDGIRPTQGAEDLIQPDTYQLIAVNMGEIAANVRGIFGYWQQSASFKEGSSLQELEDQRRALSEQIDYHLTEYEQIVREVDELRARPGVKDEEERLIVRQELQIADTIFRNADLLNQVYEGISSGTTFNSTDVYIGIGSPRLSVAEYVVWAGEEQENLRPIIDRFRAKVEERGRLYRQRVSLIKPENDLLRPAYDPRLEQNLSKVFPQADIAINLADSSYRLFKIGFTFGQVLGQALEMQAGWGEKALMPLKPENWLKKDLDTISKRINDTKKMLAKAREQYMVDKGRKVTLQAKFIEINHLQFKDPVEYAKQVEEVRFLREATTNYAVQIKNYYREIDKDYKGLIEGLKYVGPAGVIMYISVGAAGGLTLTDKAPTQGLPGISAPTYIKQMMQEQHAFGEESRIFQGGRRIEIEDDYNFIGKVKFG